MTYTEDQYRAVCEARNTLAYKCGWFESMLDLLASKHGGEVAGYILRSLASLDAKVKSGETTK